MRVVVAASAVPVAIADPAARAASERAAATSRFDERGDDRRGVRRVVCRMVMVVSVRVAPIVGIGRDS
jgi:hypothetical protein